MFLRNSPPAFVYEYGKCKICGKKLYIEREPYVDKPLHLDIEVVALTRFTEDYPVVFHRGECIKR